MEPEQVDEYLAQYREAVGRVGFLEVQVPFLKDDLRKREESLAAYHALDTPVREEGMPHGSGTGNPVEKIVLKYANGGYPEELWKDRNDLEALESELRRKRRVVNCVNAWMRGLNEREAWIINHKVIDSDYSWREVIMMYRLQYGEEYSRDALKRVKDRAMEKIYRFAE